MPWLSRDRTTASPPLISGIVVFSLLIGLVRQLQRRQHGFPFRSFGGEVGRKGRAVLIGNRRGQVADIGLHRRRRENLFHFRGYFSDHRLWRTSRREQSDESASASKARH